MRRTWYSVVFKSQKYHNEGSFLGVKGNFDFKKIFAQNFCDKHTISFLFFLEEIDIEHFLGGRDDMIYFLVNLSQIATWRNTPPLWYLLIKPRVWCWGGQEVAMLHVDGLPVSSQIPFLPPPPLGYVQLYDCDIKYTYAAICSCICTRERPAVSLSHPAGRLPLFSFALVLFSFFFFLSFFARGPRYLLAASAEETLPRRAAYQALIDAGRKHTD